MSETIPLPHFTLAKTQTKETIIQKLLLIQSPEKHVNTHIPLNATTPLLLVLPVDTVEIPTAQTVVY